MSAAVENSEYAPTGTVEELLQVAERMFAQQGVENVALTQIVAQAGQRNRSALHYHFGSRDGVLTAVMNRRLAPLNARREALVDALPADCSVPQILHAYAAPLAMVAIEEPWGPDYLSLLAQLTFHPQLLGSSSVEDQHLTGLRRCRRLLAGALPDVAPELLDQRLGWLRDSLVFALARWVRDTPAEARSAAALSALLDQIIIYGAAGLAAPVRPHP
ncbi:TetR/AcrR family transcriptional regulator [Phenylobacterium montanum]|uniref:TetR/AcrR family transcriptional regulator n=1 Tax=Phenylobacterium montanum TaxID=2823693 RepID=A0A975G0M3_9CAUL|nr:TetR/AcrR family transcriptional regulator [Caulobacter sp. S6]QUD88925.1 TetR/AcrR family transcriptional regulator [Caulobacter sp. S6]